MRMRCDGAGRVLEGTLPLYSHTPTHLHDDDSTLSGTSGSDVLLSTTGGKLMLDNGVTACALIRLRRH
jgi:hypothetical protein